MKNVQEIKQRTGRRRRFMKSWSSHELET